jgi:membrane protein DedA with SNARE-associated domain
MDLAALIQNYGYLGVAFGAFLEGETVLILAGFAAHRGYLLLSTTILVATLASFLGDQFYFLLGRRYGITLLARFPSLRAPVERMNTLVQRYHTPLILSLRFLYGLRIAGPLAIGMSELPWLRFFILNLLSAALWAAIVAGAGYAFGQVLESLFSDLHRYEEMVIIVIAAAGLLVWLIKRHRKSADPAGR